MDDQTKDTLLEMLEDLSSSFRVLETFLEVHNGIPLDVWESLESFLAEPNLLINKLLDEVKYS
jgi:hypothetical protein